MLFNERKATEKEVQLELEKSGSLERAMNLGVIVISKLLSAIYIFLSKLSVMHIYSILHSGKPDGGKLVAFPLVWSLMDRDVDNFELNQIF